MLVALSFAWGLTWPAMRVALDEIPPFSMRIVSLGLGGGALSSSARFKDAVDAPAARSTARISSLRASSTSVVLAPERDRDDVRRDRPRRDARLHDADLGGAVRLARARRTAVTARVIALALCIAGMAILIWPLAQTTSLDRPADRDGHCGQLGRRHGLYEMGAHAGDPVANRGMAGRHRVRIVVLCCRSSKGAAPSQAHATAVFGADVRRADGLGARLFPVVRGHRPGAGDDGVARRAERAGDRRGLDRGAARGISDAPDIVGYVLIFAASVCVLLQARSRRLSVHVLVKASDRALEKTLRVDIDLELDVALALRRIREPVAQIGRRSKSRADFTIRRKR